MKLLPKLGNVLFGMPTLVFLLCLPPALSDNWNRFRGPDGAGSLKTGEFPTSWTEKDYAWSCKLPGVGHSSPVLWGEKLFTTCASESTGEQFVLCLDAKSGKKLWQKNFPSKVYPHHKFNSFASATLCRLRFRLRILDYQGIERPSLSGP